MSILRHEGRAEHSHTMSTDLNQPISEETLSYAQVQLRMREQRWTYQPRYSTKDRHLYYARSARTWALVEPAHAGHYKVTYYASCACGGV